MRPTHCQRYGHIWRYEKLCGRSLRVCVECGMIQYLLDSEEWQEGER